VARSSGSDTEISGPLCAQYQLARGCRRMRGCSREVGDLTAAGPAAGCADTPGPGQKPRPGGLIATSPNAHGQRRIQYGRSRRAHRSDRRKGAAGPGPPSAGEWAVSGTPRVCPVRRGGASGNEDRRRALLRGRTRDTRMMRAAEDRSWCATKPGPRAQSRGQSRDLDWRRSLTGRMASPASRWQANSSGWPALSVHASRRGIQDEQGRDTDFARDLLGAGRGRAPRGKNGVGEELSHHEAVA